MGLPTVAESIIFDFSATTSFTINPYWSYPTSDAVGLSWGPAVSPRAVGIGDLNDDGLDDIVAFPSYAGVAVFTDPVVFINDGGGNWTESLVDLPTSQPQDVNGVFIFQWNGQNYLFATDSGWDYGGAAPAEGAQNWLWQWNPSTQSFEDKTSLLSENAPNFNQGPWAGNIYTSNEYDVLVPSFSVSSNNESGVKWYAFVNGSDTVEDLTADLPADIQFRPNRLSYVDSLSGDIQQGIGSLVVADLTGDGEQDIVTAGYGDDSNGAFATIQIFAGTGVDSFSNDPLIIQAPAYVQNPANGFAGASKIIAADIEGIERPDLIVLYEGATGTYIQILHNNGNYSFTDITNEILPDGPILRGNTNTSSPVFSISAIDLTGDGFPDLILSPAFSTGSSASSNSQDFIYLNDAGKALVPYQFSNLTDAALSSLSLDSAITPSGPLGTPIIASLSTGAPPSLITFTPNETSPVMINGFEFSPYYSLTVTPSKLDNIQYSTWNEGSIAGSALNENLALYGPGGAGGSAEPEARQSTFTTTIDIDCTAPIQPGQPSFDVSVNGTVVGSATMTANSTGGYYQDEVFQFELPGLVDINDLALDFQSTARINGVTVNGVALTQDAYTASGQSPVEQTLGSTFYNEGDSISVDASPWDTQVADANAIGTAVDPIQVNGGGGTDIVDLLGRPLDYQITGFGTDALSVSEDSGLDQNAVLSGVAYLAFSDGVVIDAATGNAVVSVADAFLRGFVSDFLIENTAGAVVAGEVGSNGQATYTQIGSLGPSWDFEGTGDYLGDGQDQILLRNVSGAIDVGEVGSNNQLAYTQVGSLGSAWSFEGSGNLLGDGKDQFLLQGVSGAVVVGEVGSNDQAVYTQIATLGPGWSFEGVGDFYEDGKDQYLLRNSSGGLVVGEVGSNDQTNFTGVGSLGAVWVFEGVGDFYGDGRADFLLRNAASSALVVGEVGSNDVASYTQVGVLGSPWVFEGVGDYSGTGTDSFLVQNSVTGAIVTGTVVSGQASYSQIGALPAAWSFPTGPSATPVKGDLLGNQLSDILIQNSGSGAILVGELSGGQEAYTQVSSLGSSWTFEGVGDYFGDGRDQYLLQGSSGAVVVGEVQNGQTAAYTQVSTLGSSWSFKGTGDYLGDGRDQYLLENTSGSVVVGEVSNGQTTYTQVYSLGSGWTFEESGSFFGDARDEFLIENTAGQLFVGEVGQTSQASFTQVGSLASIWSFRGAGDFLGDGKDQILIENTAGAVLVGEVGANNQETYTQIATLGSQWVFEGVGEYTGTGPDSFLIENTSTNAVLTGTVVNGQAQYAQVGSLGSVWQFHR